MRCEHITLHNFEDATPQAKCLDCGKIFIDLWLKLNVNAMYGKRMFKKGV